MASPTPGTSLGPYKILSALGAGGMGEVYRARDTKLNRDVAIKVLLPAVANDPDRLARFSREAQVLASLNHPNIAHIHGIEESNGIIALVMELVEGEDLSQRIARGALPMDEALPIARQIAEALEAAHEQGIIHRDLKPANIKVRGDGTVKVLDFGLAKAIDPADTSSATAMNSPTISMHATQAGLILGTAAYMSPEQAAGKPVDRRSDLWAFGVVLLEMLTGRRVFTGETTAHVLAEVLTKEPDWTTLPGNTPAPIRRLLRRCLERDRKRRIESAADARLEIEDALFQPSQGGDAAVSRGWRAPIALLSLALVTLLVVAVAVWWRPGSRLSSPSAQASEFGVTFPSNFYPINGIAISPDGRQIAANVWSNAGNIWMYSFDGSPPRPLVGGELGAFPFWSPDSTTLGFFQGGQIVTMSPAGGQTTRVAPIRSGRGGRGATWNRDNVILFSDGAGLFRVPATGGSPPIEVPIAGVSGALSGPMFLPDGRHFVFCAEGPAGGSIELASLDGDGVKNLGESQCPGGFAPPDHVLFVRGGSLLAQKLDLRRLTLEGEAHIVAVGVNRGAAGAWPALTVSASDTGVLALPTPRGGSSVGQLTWFNREGGVTGAIEARPGDDGENLNPQISPVNDNLIAANRLNVQTGAWHVWLIDASRNNAASRLTTDSATDVDPVWSPDGKEILYTSEREGGRAFYRQSIAGGPPERVLDVSGLFYPMPTDWSKHGYLLFQQFQQSIWALRLGDRVPIRLANGPTSTYAARLSPDGRWLAYNSTGGGAFELFVEGFPGGSPRKQISNGGGVHPRWTRGGKEVVYWTPPGGIKSNELTFTAENIAVGPTKTLVAEPVLGLTDARVHFDITRDGQKILVRQAAGPPSPGIRVIVNWMAKLK